MLHPNLVTIPSTIHPPVHEISCKQESVTPTLTPTPRDPHQNNMSPSPSVGDITQNQFYEEQNIQHAEGIGLSKFSFRTSNPFRHNSLIYQCLVGPSKDQYQIQQTVASYTITVYK